MKMCKIIWTFRKNNFRKNSSQGLYVCFLTKMGYFRQKKWKFQFFQKSSKTVLVQICLKDLWISSCATILQPQCTCITPLPRDFRDRLPHPKTYVFSHKTSYNPWYEFLRGVLPKVIFSKSSDDFEHFHISRFLHISHTFGAIGHWKLTY